MHASVGVDAGDLQVEPFHLDFDVHENTGMKKRTLTFERPFQTKSPDSLRRRQRINQNRVPIPDRLQKVTPQAKKSSRLLRTLLVGLVALHSDALFVDGRQNFGQEVVVQPI